MRKLKIYFIIILTIGLTGCEKFLDKRDPTATSFDEFFNDEEDLRRVTYSTYFDVFTNHTNRRTLFYMLDGRSDNGYARIEGDHHQIMANGNFNSNSRAAEYYYTLHLKHVGRLNTYIANIDGPYVEDEAIRTRYENILKALRLWHYFELTFHWGDVPFYLEPADLEDALQPPTPKEKILDAIFPMAEEIANKLPADEYVTNRYMFNQYSFKALIMRYALFNGRYALAARLAKEIIDINKYTLYPKYGDLFQYEGAAINKEFIIRMNLESFSGGANFSFRDLGPQFRTGAGQSYMVPLKSLVDSYWTLQGRPIDNCPLHPKKAYELNPKLNRDPRYSASIIGNGDVFYGETINIYNQNSPMFHEKQRASKSGYWFKKFVSEKDAFRNGNLEFPLLRYAEVLLTYAEAKIQMGDIDVLAKSCINQVRQRAGLDMTEADVTLTKYSTYLKPQWLELLQNERRIEFAAEGLRYYDIIRWKIAENVLNKPAMGHTRDINGELVSLKIEDRSFLPHHYLWPFHESSLKVEPALKQNQGY